jgi:sigma-E factor negative regulatory protein RseC
MTEEIGIVKSVDGKVAKVDVPKKNACDGCTLGTCKEDEQSMEIEAFNQAGAEAGQKVKVIIRSYTYMKGTMLIYGVPALALVIGAVLGKELFSVFFAGIDPDILSAISGFSLFVISFIIIRIWTNIVGKRVESKPVIEEILS